MKVMTLARILLLFFVCVLVYINYLQGNTIAEQRRLIRNMQSNPACDFPDFPKPAARRGRFV